MYKSFMHPIMLILTLAALCLCACSNIEQGGSVNHSDGTFTTFSVSPAEADSAEPAVAVDREGNAHVLYVQHNPDKTADLYLHTRNGRAIGTVESTTRVNPVAGTAKAWRGDPPTIAVDANGTIYVGWTVKAEAGGKTGTDLVLSASSDGGKSFVAPVRVNDDSAPASHGMHSLLVSNGTVYVAWLDERNIKKEPAHSSPAAPGASMMLHHTKEPAEPNSEVYFSVSTDGGKTFSPNKKLAAEVCPCCKTSMAAAPDGRVYISWRQVLPEGFRHIAVASTPDKGATFSEGVIVSDDQWKIDACPVSGPSMAVNDKGVLNISWFAAGEAKAGTGMETAGLFAARSTDGGKTFSERQMIGRGAVSGTPVMLLDAKGEPASVFAAKEDRVVFDTGQIFSIDQARRELIPGASLPSAVVSGGKAYIAFVRASGEKRSVWLALTTQ
jgi:hypothetical protein